MQPSLTILGLPVYILQSQKGKEVEAYNEHMAEISKLTANHTFGTLCSVSGADMRTKGLDKATIDDIEELINRYKLAYEKALLAKKNEKGGSVCYLPAFIIVQNYGYGIYGIHSAIDYFKS